MAARLTLLACLVALTGCVELFDELPESERIRPEAGADDAGADGGDALADAIVDAMPDAMTDAMQDGMVDAMPDALVDATPDAADMAVEPCEADELRCDGLDDDCDGLTDEGLVERCGPDAIGVCRPGRRDCVDGAWGACEGAVEASDEICDGLDNDCDLAVDEERDDCDCLDDEIRGCYGGPDGTEGVGLCVAGEQRCAGGRFGPCEGRVLPGDERCDGLDDDCDGRVDEGLGGEPCRVGVGACGRDGAQVCRGGAGLACDAVPGDPALERCDGVDDDCDGRPDEDLGLGAACAVGVGACRVDGLRVCAADGAVECDAVAGAPGAEVCNTVDDDCDGQIDEGADGEALTVDCYTPAEGMPGVGICRAGARACVAGQLGACVGDVGPRAEACDTLDNDCDGRVDEGVDCACDEGETEPCYTGAPGTDARRPCRAGTTTCVRMGAATAWGPCVGEVVDAPEVCDDVDNDCDGRVDEALVRGCSAGVGACARQDAETCVRGAWVCDAVAGQPADEVCNGVDDDCDGQLDEDTAVVCSAGVGGCRVDGLTACVDGQARCGAVAGQPAAERCDGVDDDCDGRVDEGEFGPCVDGVGACVSEGVEVCDAGAPVCRREPDAPEPERCNAIDDDCDGALDEAPDDGAALCEARPGAAPECRGGVCVLVCEDGALDANGAPDDGCELGCRAAEPTPIAPGIGAALSGAGAIAAASGQGISAVAFVSGPATARLVVDGAPSRDVVFGLVELDGVALGRTDAGLALVAYDVVGEGRVDVRVMAVTFGREGLSVGQEAAATISGVPVPVWDPRGALGATEALVWAEEPGGALWTMPLPLPVAPAARPEVLPWAGDEWRGGAALTTVMLDAEVAVVGLVGADDAIRVRAVTAGGGLLGEAPIALDVGGALVEFAAGGDRAQGVLAVAGALGRARATRLSGATLQPTGMPFDLPLTPGAVLPIGAAFVVGGLIDERVAYVPVGFTGPRARVGTPRAVADAVRVSGDPAVPRLVWIDSDRGAWRLELECGALP